MAVDLRAARVLLPKEYDGAFCLRESPRVWCAAPIAGDML